MTVRPTPDGYTSVTPWLINADTAGLIEYLKEAFGAEELARIPGADGRIDHAEVRIGDAVIMLFDSVAGWPATPGFFRLYVPDAAATHRQAVAAGGTSVTEVTRLAFGDRVGRVADPFGNLWWIQTHEEDVAPEQMQQRFTDPQAVKAMAYVQSTLQENFVPRRD